MALFRSRYANYLITLPDRRGLRFMNGRLETHVPEEVALVRAICRAEARGNAAVQELGGDGLPLPHARQGLGPDNGPVAEASVAPPLLRDDAPASARPLSARARQTKGKTTTTTTKIAEEAPADVS